MKKDKQTQITHSLFSAFVQCTKGNTDCDLMNWAIANQDLVRLVKTPETPDVISVRAKGNNIDNAVNVCNNTKQICNKCAEKQR